MHIVEVWTLGDKDFEIFLKEIRFWLDEHRCAPSTFAYFDLNPGMSIQVSFKDGEEAEAFARRFGGSLKQPASNGQVLGPSGRL
jgi:hypothetical protein